MKRSQSAHRNKMKMSEDFFNKAKRISNETYSNLQILMEILNLKIKNKNIQKIQDKYNKSSIKEMLFSRQLFPPDLKKNECFFSKVF